MAPKTISAASLPLSFEQDPSGLRFAGPRLREYCDTGVVLDPCLDSLKSLGQDPMASLWLLWTFQGASIRRGLPRALTSVLVGHWMWVNLRLCHVPGARKGPEPIHLDDVVCYEVPNLELTVQGRGNTSRQRHCELAMTSLGGAIDTLL